MGTKNNLWMDETSTMLLEEEVGDYFQDTIKGKPIHLRDYKKKTLSQEINNITKSKLQYSLSLPIENHNLDVELILGEAKLYDGDENNLDLMYLKHFYEKTKEPQILEKIIDKEIDLDIIQNGELISMIEEYRKYSHLNLRFNLEYSQMLTLDQRYDEALKIVEESENLILDNIDGTDYNFTLGFILFEKGEYEPAIKAFEEGNQFANFEDFECTDYLIKSYLKIKDIPNATYSCFDLLNVIALVPEHTDNENVSYVVSKLEEIKKKYPKELEEADIKLDLKNLNTDTNIQKATSENTENKENKPFVVEITQKEIEDGTTDEDGNKILH